MGQEDYWSGAWQPTPVILPGEPHGQGTLVSYSSQGHKESHTTEVMQHAHTQQASGK